MIRLTDPSELAHGQCYKLHFKSRKANKQYKVSRNYSGQWGWFESSLYCRLCIIYKSWVGMKKNVSEPNNKNDVWHWLFCIPNIILFYFIEQIQTNTNRTFLIKWSVEYFYTAKLSYSVHFTFFGQINKTVKNTNIDNILMSTKY